MKFAWILPPKEKGLTTTDANLKTAQQLAQSKGLTQKITDVLCVDFAKVTQIDVNKPLVSAICAMLLIEGAQGNVPATADVQGLICFKSFIIHFLSILFDYFVKKINYNPLYFDNKAIFSSNLLRKKSNLKVLLLNFNANFGHHFFLTQ